MFKRSRNRGRSMVLGVLYDGEWHTSLEMFNMHNRLPYIALTQLVEEGLVETKRLEGPEPRRIVYRLKKAAQ